VLLTFGLLSAEQGHRVCIARVAGHHPGISQRRLHRAGQTHPNLLRDEGEAYRLSLERLAKDLGVQKHVVFFNRFVEVEES